MYIYEINDIIFLIKSLNVPTGNFDIRKHIVFNNNATRSGSHLKLCHPRTSSAINHHFYFNQIVRIWNQLPVIDLLSPYIIKQLTKIYGITSQSISTQTNLVLFTSYALVTDAQDYQFPLTFFLSDQLRATAI